MQNKLVLKLLPSQLATEIKTPPVYQSSSFKLVTVSPTLRTGCMNKAPPSQELKAPGVSYRRKHSQRTQIHLANCPLPLSSGLKGNACICVGSGLQISTVYVPPQPTWRCCHTRHLPHPRSLLPGHGQPSKVQSTLRQPGETLQVSGNSGQYESLHQPRDKGGIPSPTLLR